MTAAENDQFRDFFYDVRPIRLKEPLAETLGAFKQVSVELEYSYIDAVKAAGHACPTVTGAFLCCQESLEALYEGETPVRGEIAITIYGKPEEGALGVMAQVFTYLTGAAPDTGFKGLGSRFKRRGLLTFDPEKIDEEATCCRFERLDTGRSVTVKFYPWLIPYPGEKAKRLATLMQQVISGEADDEARNKFQSLWVEKIQAMIIERREIGNWLRLELAGN
ncbi:MAG: hypothetical protein ACYDGS_05175 [Thermoleophilia bacterium]